MTPAGQLVLGSGVTALGAFWCYAYGHDVAARVLCRVSTGLAAGSWFLWAVGKVGW